MMWGSGLNRLLLKPKSLSAIVWLGFIWTLTVCHSEEQSDEESRPRFF